MALTKTYLADAVVSGAILTTGFGATANVSEPGALAATIITATESPILITGLQATLNAALATTSLPQLVRIWLNDGTSNYYFADLTAPAYLVSVGATGAPTMDFRVRPGFVLPVGWSIKATMAGWANFKDDWTVLAFGRRTLVTTPAYGQTGVVGAFKISSASAILDNIWPTSWPTVVQSGMFPLVTAGERAVKVESIRCTRIGSGTAASTTQSRYNILRTALNGGDNLFLNFRDIALGLTSEVNTATTRRTPIELQTPTLVLPPGWTLYVGKYRRNGATPDDAETIDIEALGYAL